MGRFCIAMLLGAYSLGLFHELPDASWLLSGCVLAFWLIPNRHRIWAGTFFCGIVVMWQAAGHQLGDRVDPELTDNAILLDGEIAEFPVLRDGTLRFVFLPGNRPDLPAKIRLGWFDPAYFPDLGETWQLQIRLKRPRGLHNPHGYDFEAWLYRQGIGATGYVVEDGQNRRLFAERPRVTARLRQRFVARVSRLLPNDGASAVLMAIGVGARHNISREDWDRYARTGTSHLMAISGLHIGLAAGSVFCLIWMLLALFCQSANLRDVAVIGASLAAGSYALLAGFAIPARRAFLMILLIAVGVLMRRRIEGSFVLPLAAITIFLFDPVSILTPGFKLSFAAVAVLYSLSGHLRRSGPVLGSLALGKTVASLHTLWSMQFALLFGLFALTVLVFDRFALIAPLVNALALPVFNFLTVPLCLLGLIFDGSFQWFGDALLGLSYQSIRLVLALISFASANPYVSFDVAALSPLLEFVALLPVMYVLLPRGWPGRGCIFIAAIAVLLYRPPNPAPGCLQYTVLDVGQGLAVVVRTQHRTLLFDTGPAFRDGSDTASTTLLPYFRKLGVRRVDRLVVSHADLDHAGGLDTLRERIEIADVVVGEPTRDLNNRCRANSRWEWDGVKFEFVHPRNPAAWTGNNRSCVLLIENGEHRFLLTGDIEKPVETLLSYLDVLPTLSSIVVPHHGSGTSSSGNLTNKVQADIAIVSAGFGNRWGMPKDTVVKRWQASGARVVNSATSGAISQQLCAGQPPGEIVQQRLDGGKYWHDAPAQSPRLSE